MTVDGKYTEKWTKSGTFSLLSSTKVFIGGSNQPYKLPGANTKTNFVGCMKKVCFSLSALPLARYPWWVVFFVSWWADLANLLLLPFQSMRANQGLFSWWWHVLFVCLVVLSALLQNLQRQAINAITRDKYWLELWTCNLALLERGAISLLQSIKMTNAIYALSSRSSSRLTVSTFNCWSWPKTAIN